MGKLAGYLIEQPLADRQAQGAGLAVLIGLAPPKSAVDHVPLMGRPGSILARLAGLPYPAEYVTMFDRANLLDARPPTFTTASPSSEAALRIERHLRGRVVLALGRGVAMSFCLECNYYRWSVVWLSRGRWRSIPWNAPVSDRPFDGLHEEGRQRGMFLVCVVPHPLRLARFDRDPGARSVDEGFWRSLVAKLRAQYATGSTSTAD